MFEQSAPTSGDGADHGASDGTDWRTRAYSRGRTNRPHGDSLREGRGVTRVLVAGGR